MKIDRKTLSLVVPVDQEDGKTLYVHIRSLSREVFEQNYRIIGQTINLLYAEGLGVGAPRLAALALKDLAVKQKIWPQVEAGLVAEMHRGASVLAQNDKGAYEVFLWDDAVARGVISTEDALEVDGAITFFTVACCMHTRKELTSILETLAGMWAAQESYLTPTAFASSLRTPIAPDPTPPKATPSLIPL
jgi:hypothetical protein